MTAAKRDRAIVGIPGQFARRREIAGRGRRAQIADTLADADARPFPVSCSTKAATKNQHRKNLSSDKNWIHEGNAAEARRDVAIWFLNLLRCAVVSRVCGVCPLSVCRLRYYTDHRF
jgi:hypothetical protein